MSRAAQELERQLKEMRSRGAKERAEKQGRAAGHQEASVENPEDGKSLNDDTTSDIYVDDLKDEDKQVEAPGGNDAAGAGNSEEGTNTTMAKKKSGGKKKAAKAPKAPKAVKAPKTPKAPKAPKVPKEARAAEGEVGERKRRVKEIVGAIIGCEVAGNHGLVLQFETGHVSLAPTANRDVNRDIAVKGLKALIAQAGK